MRNEKFLCANSSAHFNYYAKNKGFTLSELLMSVLVISIIMVAMAPVITKRVSDNISVADVKTEGILSGRLKQIFDAQYKTLRTNLQNRAGAI